MSEGRAHGLEARVERLEQHLRGLGLEVLTPEQADEQEKKDRRLAAEAAKAAKEEAAAAKEEAPA